MKQWSRSLVVLGMAFASSVAITIALVVIVVQDRASSSNAQSEPSRPTIAQGAIPPATGGSLSVSGDRDATFSLDSDSYDVGIDPDFERGFARVEFGRFGLEGEQGAIAFSTDPLVVEQIDFDGLAFYPDPDNCAITPGELNPAIGVASARLECASLTDIRDKGTVSLDGAIALPADLLGMRGDLPPPGGRIEAGDRMLEFSDGRMLVQNALTEDTERQPLFLYGDDEASSLGFERDPETAELFLTYLVIDEELFDVPEDACLVTDEDLGAVNPITTAQELTITCEPLDLGSHGVVAVAATLVIDLIVPPELVARR
jgi:hypothetical protein